MEFQRTLESVEYHFTEKKTGVQKIRSTGVPLGSLFFLLPLFTFPFSEYLAEEREKKFNIKLKKSFKPLFLFTQLLPLDSFMMLLGSKIIRISK